MERTQEGDLTEGEICKFWTALSGQEVKAIGEIPEVGIQEMVGKTETGLREFLIENGPAIFSKLPDAEEEEGTMVEDTAVEEEVNKRGRVIG